MNDNFREWYLAVNYTPEEGQIDKRIDAIEMFCENVSRDDVINLIKLYYEIKVSEEFKKIFIKIFVSYDDSFKSANDRELQLLAGATLVNIVETNNILDSVVELFIIALNPFRKASLVPEIYDEIVANFHKDSIKLRDTSSYDNELQLNSQSLSLLKSYIADNEIVDLDETGLNYMLKVFDDFKNNQDKFLVMQKKNNKSMSVYREDSQILWWIMGEYCNELDTSLKSSDKTKLCLVLGKEISDLINNYPGPIAIKAVLKKMVSLCKGKTDKLSVDNVIMSLSNDWKIHLINAIDIKIPQDMLPLIYAISESRDTESVEEWLPKFKRNILINSKEIKLTQIEYAWQMYIECLAVKCYQSLDKEC